MKQKNSAKMSLPKERRSKNDRLLMKCREKAPDEFPS